MSEAQQQETPQPPTTIPCDDLNSFVRMLSGWHQEAVARVNHLQQVPVDSVFQVEGDAEIVMTPAVLAGFKLGIELTMAQLGSLPFVAEIEDDDEEQQDSVAESASAAG